MKIFFDGGCRPDPIGMETAVVVGGRTFLKRDLGPGTSMAAEWLALIYAARIAWQLGLTDPLFLGDSAAVVEQANGVVRCRPAYASYLDMLATLRSTSAPFRIRHVKRTQNLAGIALARLQM